MSILDFVKAHETKVLRMYLPGRVFHFSILFWGGFAWRGGERYEAAALNIILWIV